MNKGKIIGDNTRINQHKTDLAKKVIDALKGVVFPKGVDYLEIPLFLERGFGIHEITEGPGRHIAEDFRTYDVPAEEVYALIEIGSIGMLSGKVSLGTYKFAIGNNGELEFKDKDIYFVMCA